MLEIDNQTNYSLNPKLFDDIATYLLDTPKTIELIITHNDVMQSINLEHRSIDKPTDVLSFPFEQVGYENELLGAIIISYDYVLQGAQTFQHSEDDECHLLFIHGLLHLLGYNHEVDNGEMRLKEQETITHFNLPSSLIIRTQQH